MTVQWWKRGKQKCDLNVPSINGCYNCSIRSSSNCDIYSHVWAHRLGSINECFSSTHTAKHSSGVWTSETYTCSKKWGACEVEVSMCVWKGLSRNLCWHHMCECERGPLVLSDRGIRSEGGIYLSLSDSLRLVSCSATCTGCWVRKQPLGRERGKTVALTRK